MNEINYWTIKTHARIKPPPITRDVYEEWNEFTGKILHWIYNDVISCYSIERMNGVQYIYANKNRITSLPLYELKELSHLTLLNRSRNYIASTIEYVINKECKTIVFEWIKPKKAKRI